MNPKQASDTDRETMPVNHCPNCEYEWAHAHRVAELQCPACGNDFAVGGKCR
jgi:predicted RNA-binding Zn-ribbon protein involved in translation (DUF1610 family)